MPTGVRCAHLSESLSRWGARAYGSPCSLITRVEESNCKLLESERKLQEERHRTAVLEQQLEKMRLEPGRTSASQRAAPRSKTGRAEVGPARGHFGAMVLWGSWF